MFISLDKLLDCEHKNEIIEAFKNKIIIEEFLREFNPKNLKTKLRIEDSSENEEEPVKKPKNNQKKNNC